MGEGSRGILNADRLLRIGLSVEPWPTIVTRPHMSPAPTKISRPKFKNSAKVDKTTVYVRLGTNSVSTH